MAACAEALRVALMNQCDSGHRRRDSVIEVVVDFHSNYYYLNHIYHLFNVIIITTIVRVDAEPTDVELDVYSLNVSVMSEAERVLADLRLYAHGATDYIRQASLLLLAFIIIMA